MTFVLVFKSYQENRYNRQTLQRHCDGLNRLNVRVNRVPNFDMNLIVRIFLGSTRSSIFRVVRRLVGWLVGWLVGPSVSL